MRVFVSACVVLCFEKKNSRAYHASHTHSPVLFSSFSSLARAGGDKIAMSSAMISRPCSSRPPVPLAHRSSSCHWPQSSLDGRPAGRRLERGSRTWRRWMSGPCGRSSFGCSGAAGRTCKRRFVDGAGGPQLLARARKIVLGDGGSLVAQLPPARARQPVDGGG